MRSPALATADSTAPGNPHRPRFPVLQVLSWALHPCGRAADACPSLGVVTGQAAQGAVSAGEAGNGLRGWAQRSSRQGLESWGQRPRLPGVAKVGTLRPGCSC